MAVIRPRTPSDLPGLVTILDGLRAERYPGPLAGTTRREVCAWLETYVPLRSWVAERDGAVLGHVQVSDAAVELCEALGTSAGHVLEVGRLFVRQSSRRSGVGAGLLRVAASWTELQGAQPVLRVSDYLHGAMRLYRSEGWTEVGRIRSSLNGDRLVVFTRT